MSMEELDMRIAQLEGQVYGHNVQELDRIQGRFGDLSERIDALCEALDSHISADIRDNRWMLEQKITEKLDFAVREIKNAVLEGSLTEMNETELSDFITMLAKTESIPF